MAIFFILIFSKEGWRMTFQATTSDHSILNKRMKKYLHKEILIYTFT